MDDGSTDATAAIARAAGARVLTAPRPPEGWLGKPWACHTGHPRRRGERLLFLDADTWLAPDALARLVAAHDAAGSDGLLSVQPFHVVERPYEQLSAVCNTVPILASGIAAIRPPPFGPVAFGPCLLTGAADLAAVGGFAAVAGEVVEDAALAHAYAAAGRRVRCLGGGDAVRFRMYPDGVRSLVEGWTKNLAGGAATGRVAAPARRHHLGERRFGDRRPARACRRCSAWPTRAFAAQALVDAPPPRLVPPAHRRALPYPARRVHPPVPRVTAAPGRSADPCAGGVGPSMSAAAPSSGDAPAPPGQAQHLGHAGGQRARVGGCPCRHRLRRPSVAGQPVAGRRVAAPWPGVRDRASYRRLRVPAWKDRLPEAGAALRRRDQQATPARLRSRRSCGRPAAPSSRTGGRWRPGPSSPLWNPLAWGRPHGGLWRRGRTHPFIAIQRYNRPRAQRLLARRGRLARRASTDVRRARV